jgi:hypothetical protein
MKKPIVLVMSLVIAEIACAQSKFSGQEVHLELRHTGNTLWVSLVNESTSVVSVDPLLPEAKPRKAGLQFFFVRIGENEIISRPIVLSGAISVGPHRDSRIDLLPLRSYGREFNLEDLRRFYALEDACYMVSAIYVQRDASSPLVSVSRQPVKFCISTRKAG